MFPGAAAFHFFSVSLLEKSVGCFLFYFKVQLGHMKIMFMSLSLVISKTEPAEGELIPRRKSQICSSTTL